MANLKPTYYQSGLIGVAKSSTAHMSKADIARMNYYKSKDMQPRPSEKPKTPFKPKPGGGRRTRRKGVKVYARKRRGSAYSLKSVFNF